MTNTYHKAKDIFDNSNLFDAKIIKVENPSLFRKYLSEMIKRQHSEKKFTSTLLGEKKIEVIRIK